MKNQNNVYKNKVYKNVPKNVPKKILIVRNDKLGDFILSLPTFALVKSALPDSQVCALVPQYTQDIAVACPWIDEIILDPGETGGMHAFKQLVHRVKQPRFDSSITLFSTTRIGLAVFLAGIPQRFAPATKVAQIFHNHRVSQRRSKSEKPEYAYNLDLGHHFLDYFKIPLVVEPKTPYLQFDAAEVGTLKKFFYTKHSLAFDEKIIFIHPGSGGSANNLAPEQYALLADELYFAHRHITVITAGPGERPKAQAVGELIKTAPYVIYESNHGLIQFAKHIQFADLFISGSTGPLHIAGALDVPTAGFYTRRRSATSLRWQTLNSPGRRLAFSPPDSAGELDMSGIDIPVVAKTIACTLLSK